MARLVKRKKDGPYPIAIGGDTKYICGCGLSKNQPYCDGTHAKTKSEEEGKLYWYDADANRHEASDSHPGMRSD
ncbi:MAG: CDGSH iron-sulfur domain-containing protein [Burkholderiales bacterium]